ncbi:NfeD family protein [Novosphingobium cyanobacteriorum]|uniref:NfeD family protein n=1 Tax=Novosphingobium cyanobacteriorum TaxID=3024215 RepID=A0ABT6CGX9_9SPHN|nr:NfeD family protein [Novosphingobium cyanobacteriorum]MDF8333190.1 NfeD family protein [Novosphingobium cyanobacteriorum]
MTVLLESPWAWVALGVVLAIAELLVPGYFLIWIAAAALLTGLAGLALPLPFAVLALLFVAMAGVAVLAGRRWYARNPGVDADPALNDRGGQLVGQGAVVACAISGGSGRVRHGDTEWLARGPDLPAGARVRVVGHEGTVLVVEPA